MTKKHKKDISEIEVIAEFEKRRKKLNRFTVFIGIFVATVILMVYQSGISKSTTAIILAGSFIWAFIVHVKIWRCPACNGHLGRLYLGLKIPKYRPQCGIKLIEE